MAQRTRKWRKKKRIQKKILRRKTGGRTRKGQDWVEEDEIEEEEENGEEEDVPNLHPGIPDYDEYFHDYFKLAPPPSPASDEESNDELGGSTPPLAHRIVQFSSVGMDSKAYQ
ncbi:hypothetical protein PIB30_075055 [Stylosanthes scabra]|uniref:Uncharacterized protein n=1 Tax=Stylosanthes scabra TaxID=79078 RepID=A0ABU6XS03_9FABA|nr:hypothetical protein [Stylosanthes scabra]